MIHAPAPSEFSDYIVFVDETGDHGMASVNQDFPLFGLAFCVFSKPDYSERVTPALRRLKLATFGHEMVILHEHDIRKKAGALARLSREPREAFLQSLNGLIEAAPFTLIAVIIDKRALRPLPVEANPYHLALLFGLERVFRLLSECGQSGRLTHVVVEARGKREDLELELEFRRICEGANDLGRALPLQLVVAGQACQFRRSATGRHGRSTGRAVRTASRPAQPRPGHPAGQILAGAGRAMRGLRLETLSWKKRRATGKSQ